MNARRVAHALALFLPLVACAGGAPAPSAEPAGGHPMHHAPQGGAHHGPHAEHPACAELAKTCHAHDKDSEDAHACHVLGHTASSNEACEAQRARCIATCTSDAGH